jgi:YHS domain-containing protein
MKLSAGFLCCTLLVGLGCDDKRVATPASTPAATKVATLPAPTAGAPAVAPVAAAPTTPTAGAPAVAPVAAAPTTPTTPTAEPPLAAIGSSRKCPVTGEEFKVKASTVQTVYNGKRYAFCCADCPEDFNKDPTKYVKN